MERMRIMRRRRRRARAGERAETGDERRRGGHAPPSAGSAGGGAGVLGCVSYLWMLVAMGIFAYLIVTVQSQADVIKPMQRKVATMEQRLGLSPMMTASEL